MLGWLGVAGDLEGFAARMQENQVGGSWLIFMGALTPIPFKVVCIGSGRSSISGFSSRWRRQGGCCSSCSRGVVLGLWRAAQAHDPAAQRLEYVVLLVVVVGGFVLAGLLF